MRRIECEEDTIAAISTPIGEGGIGVIRISGKKAIAIADKVFESKKKLPVKDQKSFTARYGCVLSKENAGKKSVIDEVLLLVMRAPKSFTCEDVVEISAHGGVATLQAILDRVIKEGARLAAKGEFTKRAFLNGRLDLLQAEAVLDLVKAKTDLGRRWAAAGLEGVLSRQMKSFKEELVKLLSHLEASIDFPEDFPETDSVSQIGGQLAGLAGALRKILESANLGILVKKGLKVVIAGRPNVGKSSLMNRLTKADRVIVTPYPGTTRDVIEEEIEIRGFPIRVLDTAGIQETSHSIETQGIERSKRAVADSDLVLYILDGSQPFSAEDRELLEDLNGREKIVVVNKKDLQRKLDRSQLNGLTNGSSVVESSCILEDGVQALEDEIFRFISNGRLEASEETVVSSVRQKDLLEKVLKSVEEGKTACQLNRSPDLIAVEVREALNHLGALVGEVLTEDVLETLFSRFCIGK